MACRRFPFDQAQSSVQASSVCYTDTRMGGTNPCLVFLLVLAGARAFPKRGDTVGVKPC
jgi:hypothetical protein